MKLSTEKIIALLLSGKVVAIPTETVFGLAASIYDESAIKSIFNLKNRPLSNPLIVHISAVDQIRDFVEETALTEAQTLINAFWPGPLTLVLPLKPSNTLSPLITANLNSVAVRMPKHEKTLQVIDKTGPLVAPSANKSGYPSSTDVQHVEHDFGSDFPVLDAAIDCQGIESTILAKENNFWKIAREGAIVPSNLSKILGYTPEIHSKKSTPICPGQHFKHYSPHAKVITKPYAELQDLSAVILGYQERSYPKAKKVITLGSLEAPLSIQQNLYAALRSLDAEGIEEAYIDVDFPLEERLEIIKRRIEKASSKC